MKKTMLVMAMVVALAMSTMAAAHVNEVTPSTNDANRTEGWAHFNVTDASVPGQVTVDLVSTRSLFSCFEYRSDGAPTTDTRANFNTDVTDGLWPFACVNNSTVERVLLADEYVEIRMVFGGESDERFDWTRVDVTPIPRSKDDCKDGGWETFGDYKNQGQCVSEFASSK